VVHVDEAGVPVTVAGPEAAAGWDRVVEGLLSFAPDLDARFDALFAEDPTMPAAHTLRAWLLHYTHDPRQDRLVSFALETAEDAAGQATQREREHLSAVRQLVEGRPKVAAAGWDQVLDAHPRDIVALRCAYFDRFERGDTTGTRRVAERGLTAFDDQDRWRPHVMGFAAFALSESGEHAAAERLGREATERCPADLWSVHAVAHVLEETGRQREGLRWIDDHVLGIDPQVGFTRHLWWHKALYALVLGDIDGVLAIYDDDISADSDNHLDLCNRTSLLARLQLVGVDVGDRWDELVEMTRPRVEDRRSLFFHAHIALAQAWSPGGDPDSVVRSVEEWARHDSRAREVGVDVVRAVVRGPDGRAEPDDTQRRPAPIGIRLDQLGGSRAQRSLFAEIVDRS
jgi:hypothetical protein